MVRGVNEKRVSFQDGGTWRGADGWWETLGGDVYH